MRLIISILLITTDFIFSTCSPYAIKKYSIGKRFEFSNKNEFADYIQKQTSYYANDCYYADSLSYRWLIQHQAIHPKEGILWGFYSGMHEPILMDSAEYEQLYCKQRTQDAVAHFITTSCMAPVLQIDSSLIDSLQLYRLSDSTPMNGRDIEHKQVIFLQYATGFGSYYRDLFKKITYIVQAHSTNTIIIVLCLDPVYTLH